ncbi:MAG: hypothetical protein K6G07_04205 [Lachnospiraceae bacterium]|nr:hypothetical protein [Lachnospiraceae bacterium]
MFNPLALLGIKNTLEGNHPKAAAFIKDVLLTGVTEGTVIEVSMTRPGEEPKTTNLKVKQSDLDALKQLKDIIGSQTR